MGKAGAVIGGVVAIAFAGACGGSRAAIDCGPGRLIVAEGSSYCAYAAGIVIEGGFECPEELPYEILLGGGAAVCAGEQQDPESLPSVVCSSVGRECAPALDAGRPAPPPPGDVGTVRDAAPDARGADTGRAGDAAGADAGPTACSVVPDTDCLFLSHLDGIEPADLADRCGGFVVAPSAGVRAAPEPGCDGAIAVPYTDGFELGMGFGADGIDVTGSDALSLEVNPVLTIEARVYATGVDPSGPTAGPKPTVVRQAEGQYRLFVYDGRAGALLGNTCGPFLGYRWALDPDPLPLGRWVHLLAVIDHETERVELYVDGVLKSSADTGPCTPPAASAAGARIGNTAGNDVFLGYIDEVMIRRGAHRP